ncbi:MAG: LAGLIDADG family homing endonuclease [Candidatus Heimdallarchaeota archaeon]
MAKDEIPKPIFDLGISRNKSFDLEETLAKYPEEILSLKEEPLIDYLRDIFDQNGIVFKSESGDSILSLIEENLSKLIVYQRALDRFEINSLIYFDENSTKKYQLLIIEQMSIDSFRKNVGSVKLDNDNSTLQYYLKLDWED